MGADGEELVRAFLRAHPSGGLAEWEAYAASTDASPTVIEQAQAILLERRQVEALLDSEATLPGRSVFYLRDRPGGAASGEDPDQSGPRAGMQVGSYVLKRFLARGGMGQVWEAEDPALRRRVALKFVLPHRLDRKGLEMFLREARAGARLAHPNVVTTFAQGEDHGMAWIAQELIEGSWTLHDFLEQVRADGSLPEDYYQHVASFVAQIADGVSAAHAAGVVHRDIKPSNVLITRDDVPKLADFGLARVQGDSFASQTGDLMGTWAYMSPEQVTAKRMGLDHRTDVFSLGVVLYEMLALVRPFSGDTTHQIAEQIISVDPPKADRVRRDCPRELATICSKAIKKSPNRRYQAMGELAADLRRWLEQRKITARRPGLAVRAQRWVKRRPVLAASLGCVVGTALVSGVVLAAILWWLKEPPREDLRAADTAGVQPSAERPRLPEEGEPPPVVSEDQDAKDAEGPNQESATSVGPTLIPRGVWGDEEPVVSRMTGLGTVTRMTIHHSGMPVAPEETAAEIRDIWKAHVATDGYGDIGYHFIVDREGTVWEGRSLEFQGAHSGASANEGNIGIVLLGNFDNEHPPTEQVDGLQNLVRSLQEQFEIPPARVHIHREFKNTACPGKHLVAVLLQRGIIPPSPGQK